MKCRVDIVQNAELIKCLLQRRRYIVGRCLGAAESFDLVKLNGGR